MAELTSPDTGNYAVLKGNVYFTPSGVGGTKRHMGNCTQFDFEPAVNTLDHFSSMTGIKTKDFSEALEKSATLLLTLEEITLSNLQIALLGDTIAGDPVTATSEGHGLMGFEILANALVNGKVEIIGSNTVGPKYQIILPSVNFIPSKAISFMGDSNWASIELKGDVLAVNGSFGRLDLLT